MITNITSEERKKLIEKKTAILYSKNILKLLDGRGIDVIEIYENNENEWLNKILSAYVPIMCSNNIIPYSRLSIYSDNSELYSWIISTLNLQEENEYYFLCSSIWSKIKITNIETAVKELWEHEFLGEHLNHRPSYTVGFILIDVNKKNIIMEAGYDSRDEYNRLIDIWEYKVPLTQ